MVSACSNASMRNRLLTLALVVFAGIGSSLPAAHAQPSPAEQRGRNFARVHCSNCHAIDSVSPSPLSVAPPFRVLQSRYPVESLERALAEGIVTGHPSMPEFRLDPGQISDFTAFLRSLK